MVRFCKGFYTADNMWKWGKDAITSFAEGDELRMMLLGIKCFSKTEAFNTKNVFDYYGLYSYQ